MSPGTLAADLVATLDLRIDGRPLDPISAAQLIEIRVRDSVMVPSSAHIRIADPQARLVDGTLFDIGKLVDVWTGAMDDPVAKPIFSGVLTAVEPEFLPEGIVLAARAYDRGHALTRSVNSRTFQFQTSSDIVMRVAAEAGLTPGIVEPTGLPHEVMQQSNESDWDFIWRLAAMHDFEFSVNGMVFNFRRAGPDPIRLPLQLRYGDNLLSFRPRVSAAQQPMMTQVRSVDPILGLPLEGIGMPMMMDSEPIGMPRVASAMKLMPKPRPVADAPANNIVDAMQMAMNAADRLAHTYVEAEGVVRGEPDLRAGSRVLVAQVGMKFSGNYTVSSATHIFRGGQGYTTQFSVSGRNPRTLLQLTRERKRRDWSQQLVVGVVTQNIDPLGMARVRVRFPSLGLLVESAWARVATLASGLDRGMMMLPMPGQQVIVAFEHGDTRRPIILGSLFNAIQRPSPILAPIDGGFAVKSDTNASVTATGAIALTSVGAQAMTSMGAIGLQAGGALTVSAGGAVPITAGGAVPITAGGAVPITAGGAIPITAGGAIPIQTPGVIPITAGGTITLTAPVVNIVGLLTINGVPIPI